MPQDPAGAPDPVEDLFTSDLLLRLVREHRGERLSMGDIVAGLDDRAFGLLMLLLALPNSLPMPGIPFVSTVTGTPIAFFAAQLALGYHTPWLPQRLLRQSVRRADLLRALERIAPHVRKVERLLRHRLLGLVTGPGERAAAALACLMAVILALPIPGGNFLPGLSIAFLSLGIVERDGACVVIGAVLALLGLALVGLVLTVGLRALLYLVTQGLA